MPQQTLAPIDGDLIALTPQDSRPAFGWSRAITVLLSLAVVAAAVYQMRDVDIASIFAMVPSSPLFWLLFVAGFLAGPLSEWFIFHRLWGVGLPAFGALTRKLIFNELLLGYLGEAWFYSWARRNKSVDAAPFGAVKDVAVLSAMAGNGMTLLLVAMAMPYVGVLPLGEHAAAIGWSLAFVLGTSLAAMLWRKALLSLTSDELKMVFAAHVLRIVVTTLISAALWHMVLPETPIFWWLVLVAIRLLISRLPFIPTKDVVFAGIAVVAAGPEVQIAELMTMMAGLILCANLFTGLCIAAADLFKTGAEE